MKPPRDDDPIDNDGGPIASDGGPIASDGGPIASDGGPIASDGDIGDLVAPAPLSDAPVEPPHLMKRTLAEILLGIANDTSRERVSIADLVAAMQDRAFGALMLIFAMPNAIPTPPGTSAILGAPLVFLAAQLTFGRKPWLPGLIANRSLPRADFAAMIERAAPWIARAEKLLKPRLMMVARPPAEYAVGALCLLMATILILPIPLGNMLPAIAISLFSLGLLERDGVWIIAGVVASIVSTVVVSGVIYAMVKTLIFLISNVIA